MSSKIRRRSIRLHEYDYTDSKAYFITICTYNRALLFGQVIAGKMQLNSTGELVKEEWLKSAILRPYLVLDLFVVMPNHFHAIVLLAHKQGATSRAPAREQFGKPVSGSLPTVIRAFKAAVSRCLNTKPALWQRGYYEHVIRNDCDLQRIRDYIETNPLRWELDHENPQPQGEDEFDRWLESFKNRPNPMKKSFHP
jgi:putative transposase